jgi:hypothetical protein
VAHRRRKRNSALRHGDGLRNKQTRGVLVRTTDWGPVLLAIFLVDRWILQNRLPNCDFCSDGFRRNPYTHFTFQHCAREPTRMRIRASLGEALETTCPASRLRNREPNATMQPEMFEAGKSAKESKPCRCNT